jgi:hypothetical protein
MTASLTPYPARRHRGTSHVGHLSLFVMMYASTAPAQRCNTHCITHSSYLRAPAVEPPRDVAHAGEFLAPRAGRGAPTSIRRRRRSAAAGALVSLAGRPSGRGWGGGLELPSSATGLAPPRPVPRGREGRGRSTRRKDRVGMQGGGSEVGWGRCWSPTTAHAGSTGETRL